MVNVNHPITRFELAIDCFWGLGSEKWTATRLGAAPTENFAVGQEVVGKGLALFETQPLESEPSTNWL